MELLKSPLVTVIMPAYNSEKTISVSIESVINQVFKDWELLIVDDASYDRTAQIAKQYADSDKRIHVIKLAENNGAANAKNIGLQKAAGDWIAFLDSDDQWSKEKLIKQLETAESTGADLIYSSYSMMDYKKGKRSIYKVPETCTYEDLLKENYIGSSTVLIKMSSLRQNRFRTDVYHEDYELWLRLMKNGIKARGCTNALTEWRIVKTSRSFNKIKAAFNRWLILRRIERLSLRKTVKVFAAYTLRGIRKHRRI